MSDLCTRNGILVQIEPQKLHKLSEYAVTARYPGDDPILAEAREAIEIAKAVRRFIRGLWGLYS